MLRRSIFALLILPGLPLWGQSPAFEAATVKVNDGLDHAVILPVFRNGAFTARNVSLRRLLRTAYGLSDLQILGPDWIGSGQYDVEAKFPGVPDSELMPMLRSLLHDRFHLTAHREKKEMPVFDMVIASGGLKMSPFDPAHPAPHPSAGAATRYLGAIATNGVVTMSQLAIQLAPAAGRPVVNRTNVEGSYSFMLIFTMAPSSSPSASDTTGSNAPDLFTAIREQLGLRLEPKKEFIEVLVVDRADRIPAGN
ncbi:MAG TPA: TIGR03435 family protein [Bryobacteraceae bacterium]|nr:TIGR03435 family protein [Bryobacteraceae bacterium]